MESSARYRWSAYEFSLQEFVETYKLCLPVLIRTTTGFSGYDGSMHEIGADEVTEANSVSTQNRQKNLQFCNGLYTSVHYRKL